MNNFKKFALSQNEMKNVLGGREQGCIDIGCVARCLGEAYSKCAHIPLSLIDSTGMNSQISCQTYMFNVCAGQ